MSMPKAKGLTWNSLTGLESSQLEVAPFQVGQGCFTHMAKGLLRLGMNPSKTPLPSSTMKATWTPLFCSSAEIF